MTDKKRAVVICPGRGTYNKEELGYLSRYHSDKQVLIDVIDDYRRKQNQPTISELDAKPAYQLRTHTAGEHASALIYGCALADFHSINQDEYDIVAVTGNSMGWYIALAVAEALSQPSAIELINTMGSMMVNGVIGGQLIYPIVDENWLVDTQIKDNVLTQLALVNQQAENEVHLSINLGGYLVFGGNKAGLKALEQALPLVQDRYPMNLYNHAAFHTPLMNEVSANAKSILAQSHFMAPAIPLIDGLGHIWQPYATDTQALFDYTLGTQVTDTYDFSKAIEVAIKEFAPDKLIILGPGATLGGSVAQCLIRHNWLNINNKAAFISQQKVDPFILAMGLEEQRKQAIL